MPLHMNVKYEEVVQLLVAAKAPLDAKGVTGRGPQHFVPDLRQSPKSPCMFPVTPLENLDTFKWRILHGLLACNFVVVVVAAKIMGRCAEVKPCYELALVALQSIPFQS